MVAQTRKAVAIIDDDQSVLTAVQRLLRASGHETFAFSSGEDFLKAMGALSIGCAVLDIQLGGMDGFEVQRHLCDDAPGVATIYISAHDEPGNRKRAGDAGAVAFLGKPFTEKNLLAAVGEALVEPPEEASIPLDQGPIFKRTETGQN